MSRKLPHLYRGETDKVINNNQEIFYTDNKITINREIQYPINQNVIIKTISYEISCKIVGKFKDHILTDNNKIIKLNEIVSIDKI